MMTLAASYIAASCHGVVRRFVRHRQRVILVFLFLSSGSGKKIFVTVTRYFSSRVLMTFSLFLVIVICSAMSFPLRSAAIVRLILDASVLQCTRVAIPTLLKCATSSFC